MLNRRGTGVARRVIFVQSEDYRQEIGQIDGGTSEPPEPGTYRVVISVNGSHVVSADGQKVVV